LILQFPIPKQNKKQKTSEVPKEWQTYETLYILLKGDFLSMKWFYKNMTKADLVLMTFIHNLTNPYE
jgi:hypothetical protein